MSILQEIIENMYVPPEVLSQLDDEQKQILFCKMREEQVRRFAEYEKGLDEKSNQNSTPSTARNVRWLLGSDGNPWVWVMGEHYLDKSIEQILDEETQEKARKLAEEEAETLRMNEEEELKEKLRQEQLEIEKERELQKMLNKADNKIDYCNGDINNTLQSPHEQILRQNNDPANNVVLRRKVADTNSHENSYSNNMENQKEAAFKKADQQKDKRVSEIYQSLIEAREKAQLDAFNAAEEERRYWEMQEQKFKEAEEQIRILARNARQQHKIHTMRTTTSFLNKFNVNASNSMRPQANKGRLQNGSDYRLCDRTRPESRQAVIKWFVTSELARGAILLPSTNRLASWFHGIIGRTEAERLLSNKPAGSYLIRVSDKFFGYALSYKTSSQVTKLNANDGDLVESPSRQYKHFLIEPVENGYRFFGTDQITHETIWDLITYHQVVPITLLGKEILKEGVSQATFPPDYQELLNGCNA